MGGGGCIPNNLLVMPMLTWHERSEVPGGWAAKDVGFPRGILNIQYKPMTLISLLPYKIVHSL